MSCKDCQLHTKCKNSGLKGVGSHSAKYLIVLDSPNWQDDRANGFLRGDYSRKLKYLLRKSGISPSECFVTSAIKCSVKDKVQITKQNKKKDKEGKDQKIGSNMEICRKYLLADIRRVKPKVIITMGRYAHETFTGKTSYKEYSGFFYPFNMQYKQEIGEETTEKTMKSYIIPTHCPQTSMTVWKNDIQTIHHLKKAKHFVDTGDTQLLPTPEFKRITSRKDLKEFYEEAKKYDFYAHDFETTGLSFYKDKVINSGYCFDGKKAWIIYLMDEWPKEHMVKFTEEQKLDAKKVVRFYRKNKKVIHKVLSKVHKNKAKKIGANHKFDKKFAKKMGLPFKNATEDTTVKEALIDENRPKNLNACLEMRNLNYGPYDTFLYKYVGKGKKNKKPYSFIPPEMLDKYLAIDVVGAFKLNFIQDEELKKEGVEKLYRTRQSPYLDELFRAEYRGFDIDKEMVERDIEAINRREKEALENLRKAAKDDKFNPNSPAQVYNLLESHNYPFEKAGIKKTGSGAFSTGEKELEKFMRYKKWKKIPDLILAYRGLSKLKSTYICNDDQTSGMYPLITDKGRIHTSFNIFIPVTGRLSSSEPNITNIPNPSHGINIRRYFVPPKKKEQWVVWESDFQALEMRVAALLGKDKVMYQELLDGVDMHSSNSVYFGPKMGLLDAKVKYEDFKLIAKLDDIPEEELIKKYGKDAFKEMNNLHPKYKKLRAVSKTISFGLFYGKEARSFAEETNVDQEKIEIAIDSFWGKYKGVHNYLEKNADKAVRTGELILPVTGRKRRFNAFAEWINSPEAGQIWNPDRYKSEIRRQAKNFPVQGFANEIFVGSVLKLIKAMRDEGLKSRVLNFIHDGIVAIGPLSEMKRVEELCHLKMGTRIKSGGLDVPFPVDFNANTRWYGERILDY